MPLNFRTFEPTARFRRCRFSPARSRTHENELGFTPIVLSRLLAEYSARARPRPAGCRDPVDVLFRLLEQPRCIAEFLPSRSSDSPSPISRVRAAATKLYDPVATFHLSNGARLERINVFGNLRPYGMEASYGVTVNYRYLPDELEENHERFVRGGQIRVPSNLFREHKTVADAWDPARGKIRTRKTPLTPTR